MDATGDLQNEVQELVWALVDDMATEEQVGRLEALLLDSDEARHIYVMCMQMHADLHYLLSGKRRPLPPIPVEKTPKPTAAKPLVELRPIGPTVPLTDLFMS